MQHKADRVFALKKGAELLHARAHIWWKSKRGNTKCVEIVYEKFQNHSILLT